MRFVEIEGGGLSCSMLRLMLLFKAEQVKAVDVLSLLRTVVAEER